MGDGLPGVFHKRLCIRLLHGKASRFVHGCATDTSSLHGRCILVTVLEMPWITLSILVLAVTVRLSKPTIVVPCLLSFSKLSTAF